MKCSKCGFDNPISNTICSKCDEKLENIIDHKSFKVNCEPIIAVPNFDEHNEELLDKDSIIDNTQVFSKEKL